MTLQRIVVGVDGSAAAQRVLTFAVSEAKLTNAALETIHVWSLPVAGYPASAACPVVVVPPECQQ